MTPAVLRPTSVRLWRLYSVEQKIHFFAIALPHSDAGIGGASGNASKTAWGSALSLSVNGCGPRDLA